MAVTANLVAQQPQTLDILHGTPRWRPLTAAETATAPYAAIASVRLHIVAGGGTVVFFMGTAWFLRPNTAVTAAHVTDISSAWAQVPAPQQWHLEIVPAFSGTARPFGTFWATAVRRHPLWSGRHTSPFDIATLAVTPAAGGAPFPSAQCLALRADAIAAPSMASVQISGYPHIVGAGTAQVTASGPVRIVESSLCFYDIDTEDGQSGAPVMLAGASPAAVAAIHSGGRGNGSTAASAALNAGLILRRELVDWLQQP